MSSLAVISPKGDTAFATDMALVASTVHGNYDDSTGLLSIPTVIDGDNLLLLVQVAAVGRAFMEDAIEPMDVSIVTYSERGMSRVQFVGTVVLGMSFYFLSRDGKTPRERPFPGDLFDTDGEALKHLEALGHHVSVAPSQGAAIHAGI